MCLLNRKYKMPATAGRWCSDGKEKGAPITNKASLELPVSAVTGLRGTDAEEFEEYVERCDRACPSTHCWTPAGEVLIGCSTGELLKVTFVIIAVFVVNLSEPASWFFFTYYGGEALRIRGTGSVYLYIVLNGQFN